MHAIPYLLKQDFFSPEEEKSIWEELTFLNSPHILKPPTLTGSATDDFGANKKQNAGIFLSEVYQNADYSAIWRASRKVFTGSTHRFSELHLSNTAVLSTEISTILVSYYENADHYLPHQDAAVTTVLYWFFREPKQFTGGDLIFNQTGEIIPVTHNTMIMFPSWATHSVTQVLMEPEHQNKKLGRYCISHFLQMK